MKFDFHAGMDRAVSAHKGAAFEVTFAAELCCVCGATTCAACAEGVMRLSLIHI